MNETKERILFTYLHFKYQTTPAHTRWGCLFAGNMWSNLDLSIQYAIINNSIDSPERE